MMNNISRATFTAIGVGIALAGCFVLLNALFKSFSSGDNTLSVSQVNGVIVALPESLKEIEASSILNAFNIKAKNTENVADDLLPELQSHTVRIVAQAKVNGKLLTKLAVTSAETTEVKNAREGQVINGLLVKKVGNRIIVVEKSDVSYDVVLFKGKEID